jgi:hypothetical protein
MIAELRLLILLDRQGGYVFSTVGWVGPLFKATGHRLSETEDFSKEKF